ncbi:hypothetical protein [Rathayibacter sp. SD072]|uniref:hypothetical protein n=1 Tax=Rathayibacter sp. SD072 TaxID=2781731 RepID=UPI001A95F621|nr:hypothetical protein [Rathayibacter sp. SD072]MBO0983732.1 hypothetical protein [Rathayibacter sp. SD072]
MSRSQRLGATVALALLLTGCTSTGGSDSGSDVDELDAAPAAGVEIAGDGYLYSVPEGWDVPDTDPSTIGADTLAADLTDTDGFSDNVNVVLSPAGAVTPEQVEGAGADELEGAGATDVEVRDRVQVAGAESAHLSAALTAQGASYSIEQYYLTQNEQTYVVTFSFSPTVEDDDREDLAESVLASWSWS